MYGVEMGGGTEDVVADIVRVVNVVILDVDSVTVRVGSTDTQYA